MNDKDLQEKIINKVNKLRLLIDRIEETPIRHRMDDLLRRVYLQARDGNEDAAPVQQVDLTDDEINKISHAIANAMPSGMTVEDWKRSFARAVIAADREKNK